MFNRTFNTLPGDMLYKAIIKPTNGEPFSHEFHRQSDDEAKKHIRMTIGRGVFVQLRNETEDRLVV